MSFPMMRAALRERLWLGAGLAVVLAWYAWMWGDGATFARSIDRCPILFADFHAHYRPIGEAVLTSGLPRPDFYYSPFFALLLVPFARLPDAAAVALWGLLQGLAVALLVFAPAALARGASPALRIGHALVVLTAFPTLHNFAWGQVSVPLTALAAGAFLLRERGRPWAAGVLLAVAIAIKFYLAVLVVYFVARRDVRALVACAVGCAVFLLAVPVLALGAEMTSIWYRDVAHRLTLVQDAIALDPNSHYAPSVLARLFGIDPAVGTWASRALALGCLLLAMLACRRRPVHAPLLAFALLQAAVPLLVPTSWPHYFAFLPAGCLALATLATARSSTRVRGALLMSIAACVAFASVFWFRGHSGWQSYASAAWLLWADLLLLAGLGLAVCGPLPRSEWPISLRGGSVCAPQSPP
jgi:alpha-1,2-mannosyltransferase